MTARNDPNRSMLRRGWLALAVAASLWSAPLHAQPSDGTPLTGAPFYDADKAQLTQANQLYKAGIAAQKNGNHAEALKAFRQSYGVVRSPNSHMMIVRELTELGRPIEAYREAVVAVDEAQEAAGADAEKYGKTLDAAKAELAAVKQKVALLVVNVAGATEGAALVVNGVAVDMADWGRAIPVEPGPQEVVLTTSQGELEQSAEAVVGKTVEVAIGTAPKVEAPPKPKPKAAAAPKEEEGDSLWPADWPDRKLIAVIVGGTSVLSFVNFGVFGLLSQGQADRLDSGCPPPHQDCDPLLEAQADKGRTFQALANTFLVIGLITGVAAGGFLTWDLLDDDDSGDEATARRMRVSVDPGAITLTGEF